MWAPINQVTCQIKYLRLFWKGMLEDIIYGIKVVKFKWSTYKNILLDIEPIYKYRYFNAVHCQRASQL